MATRPPNQQPRTKARSRIKSVKVSDLEVPKGAVKGGFSSKGQHFQEIIVTADKTSTSAK